MEISKETLYTPKKLEALRADVSEKLKKKSKFSFFRKIKRFFFGK
ncbi:MAG: hypothetical protein PHE16_01765 [Aliarcobacter sp.]|nr:hypothetical protein [Aliarcobacter sp.]